MDLVFEPLSQENIKEALALISAVFPTHAEEVRVAYERALDPEKAYLEDRRLFEYFVVRDTESKKVIGVTGLYNRKEYPEDEAWLGWFCVDSNVRGKGIGRKTLEWTMNRARELEYKKFKLYTSTDPNESAAQGLYESVGLKIYKREPSKITEGEEILYREVSL